MHGIDRSSGLEVEYGLAVNDWAQGGLEVATGGTRLSSETFRVWTVAHETRNMKTDETGAVRNPVDITGNPNLHAGARGTEPVDILVETGRTREFIEQGNMSEYEIKEFWEKNHKTLVLLPIETRPYAFYRFEIAFTVNVPGEERLAEIDKSSANDQTALNFWPARVVFNNGVRAEERSPAKDRHNVKVLVSLSRKPGGGYQDLLFRSVSAGYELKCD